MEDIRAMRARLRELLNIPIALVTILVSLILVAVLGEVIITAHWMSFKVLGAVGIGLVVYAAAEILLPGPTVNQGKHELDEAHRRVEEIKEHSHIHREIGPRYS